MKRVFSYGILDDGNGGVVLIGHFLVVFVIAGILLILGFVWYLCVRSFLPGSFIVETQGQYRGLLEEKIEVAHEKNTMKEALEMRRLTRGDVTKEEWAALRKLEIKSAGITVKERSATVGMKLLGVYEVCASRIVKD